MTERLLLNRNGDGVGVLHRENCPTIQHQVRGDLREELPRGGFQIIESHDDGTALVGPNTGTDRFYFEAVYVTLEELTSAGRYRRCKVCAPDAPEGPPPLQVSRKCASSLSATDIGRLSVDGMIERIEHSVSGTTVTFVGGLQRTLTGDETVSFPRTPRPDSEKERT